MAEQKKRSRNNNRGSKRDTVPERRDEKKTVQSQMYEAIKYDASNIYFNNLVGVDLTRTTTDSGSRLPGIMIFKSAPNFASQSDMLNVAATSIYTYVRHANSGRTNYESSDLMTYLIAMSEVYVSIAELTRAYGIASYFTAQNLYSGHLLKALGFKPIEARNELANVRYALNILINKVKSFAVPKVFNYFDERVSEHLNVFADEPTNRGQFIAVVPGYRGVFDPTSDGGSSIKFEAVPSNRDILEYLDTINEVVDDLRINEDINIMSGDILKAYGDNLYVPQPIPVDMVTTPVYDELQLLQFQNGLYPNAIIPGSLLQSNNRLSATMDIKDAGVVGCYTEKRYLNSPYEDVDANVVFALSKYQLVLTKEAGSDADVLRVVSANPTILYGPQIYVMTAAGSIAPGTVQQCRAGGALYTLSLINITKFKHHPYLYIQGYSLPIGDMHYVALLSETDTNRMNDARFVLAFQTLQMG